MTVVGEFWPPAEAFSVPEGDDQWSDGVARCTGIAICDEDGSVIAGAHQGQQVQILFEFELAGEIGLPSGWFELRDASGLLIFGNNSFHEGRTVQVDRPEGVRLRYRYTVQLDVAPGEYALTVGLASTFEEAYLGQWRGPEPETQWPGGIAGPEDRATRYRQVGLPDDQFEGHVTHHCRAECPQPLAVGFDKNGRRAHIGLIPLVSEGAVWVERAGPSPSNGVSSTEHPAIVHITHYKAGSQWLYAILRACAPDRIVPPDARSGHFRYWPPESGKIYPTVYLTRQQFDEVSLPPDCRVFVVIRDLRDTLISSYFSLAGTHGMLDRPSLDLRRLLESLSVEKGLLYLIDHWLIDPARIQLSWLEAGEPLIRYEDILERDTEILEEVLLNRCELGVPVEVFRQAVIARRFEWMTGGRPRGTEDLQEHMRKGIAGDWRNHFTPRVSDAFKARYGGLLVATGYEPNLDW
jgi:lipopolysaccharide transport system ATP-binding protein